MFPLFDVVEAIVLHFNGDVFVSSFCRDKWSSKKLGLGLCVSACKTIKGIAPNGDQ